MTSILRNTVLAAVLAVALAIGLPAVAMAAEANLADDVTADSPEARAVADIGLAGELARYGRAQKDPIALISAARILKKVSAEDTTRPKESEGEGAAAAAGGGPAGKSMADMVKGLAQEARDLANGKAEVLALADDAGRIVKSRGAVGGPKRSMDVVTARTTDIYRAQFRGAEAAAVAVVSDGLSDLSMVVYDNNGNIICQTFETTEGMMCQWVPRRTGDFIIKVRNRGADSSEYMIVSN